MTLPTTINYGWTLPEPGSSASSWGAELNAAFGQVDAVMFGKLNLAGGTLTGPALAAAGSAAAPGISFAGDSNSGLYWVGVDSIGLSLGGTVRVTYATTGVTVAGAVACSTLAPTGLTSIPASAAGAARLNLAQGATVTSPNAGDLWTTSGGLFARIGSTTYNLTSSVGVWSTPRTITFSGEVTGVTAAFDGSANVTGVALSIANDAVVTAKINNDAVTNPKLANMAQATIKGRAAGAGTGDPADLSAAQAAAIIQSGLDLSSLTTGTGAPGSGYVKIGPIYLMWGTDSSPTSDDEVTVFLGFGALNLPNGVLVAVAQARNPSGLNNINNAPQFKSATTSSITFYQQVYSGTSAITPAGFTWFAVGY